MNGKYQIYKLIHNKQNTACALIIIRFSVIIGFAWSGRRPAGSLLSILLCTLPTAGDTAIIRLIGKTLPAQHKQTRPDCHREWMVPCLGSMAKCEECFKILHPHFFSWENTVAVNLSAKIKIRNKVEQLLNRFLAPLRRLSVFRESFSYFGTVQYIHHVEQTPKYEL